jgi:hypothetical protein
VAIVVSDHRRNDRHFDDPLPYGAVVELNGHAVGRIDRSVTLNVLLSFAQSRSSHPLGFALSCRLEPGCLH